jgi:hypothetical protein
MLAVSGAQCCTTDKVIELAGSSEGNQDTCVSPVYNSEIARNPRLSTMVGRIPLLLAQAGRNHLR